MLIVGLTGNVGAGKSTVAEQWRQAGVPVGSADEFARQATAPGSPALARIAKLFGPSILSSDGGLDRDAARRLVFPNDDARRKLEEVVHPEVRRLRNGWTEVQRAADARLVAWEVPLLFETGMETEVDVVVLVDAPVSLRRKRIMETRGLDASIADLVIASQDPAENKRDRADYVVDNGGTLAELAERAAGVLDDLKRRAGKR